MEDRWKRRYDLAFALELNRAECELLTGRHEAAEERLSALACRAAFREEWGKPPTGRWCTWRFRDRRRHRRHVSKTARARVVSRNSA
jgi:hypothetical protein